MTNIKAVFLDVDKTMTSEIDGSLVPSCLKACRQLQAMGITVIIATGRQGLCVPFVEDGQIKPDYILAANGAAIYDSERRVLWCEYLNRKTFEEITEYCRLNHVDIFWKFVNGMYAYVGESWLAKDVNRRLSHFTIGTHPDPKALPNAGGLVCSDPEKLAEFHRLYDSRIMCVNGGLYIHDLTNLNTDKGSGLRRMAQLLGISTEECAAFGDSENDIPMLKAAGLGVAMGNAIEAARQSADYISTNASEDGVYNALKKYGIL